MARKPKPVANVYEKNAGSGIWYIRYRIDGKLVRKKVGNHQQATHQVTILQGIRASGPTIIPTSAKQPSVGRQIPRCKVKGRGSPDIIRLRSICVNPLIHGAVKRSLICIAHHLGNS
jgi:hypothetical protein